MVHYDHPEGSEKSCVRVYWFRNNSQLSGNLCSPHTGAIRPLRRLTKLSKGGTRSSHLPGRPEKAQHIRRIEGGIRSSLLPGRPKS